MVLSRPGARRAPQVVDALPTTSRFDSARVVTPAPAKETPMEPILYAGLRNPARDRESYEAILHHPVSEVAQERKCSPSTIRAAARRISEMQLFTLRLTGGGQGDCGRNHRSQVLPARGAGCLPALRRHLQEPGATHLGAN